MIFNVADPELVNDLNEKLTQTFITEFQILEAREVIAYGAYQWEDKTFTKEGYRLLGVVGNYSGSPNLMPFVCRIHNGRLQYGVRNTTAVAIQNAQPYIYLLWSKI